MAIEIKKFNNYTDYISLQKSKAPHGSPLNRRLSQDGDLWESDCEGFHLNFKNHLEKIKKCTKGICLGARTGQEVYVLKEIGLVDIIGIDLVDNPPLVIEGDVHNVQYGDNTFDFIFSNIFDHVLYPNKFVEEIERLSKPNTFCILHLSINDKADFHAANVLSDAQSVLNLFSREIEILENKPLGQKDWPAYWELVVNIK